MVCWGTGIFQPTEPEKPLPDAIVFGGDQIKQKWKMRSIGWELADITDDHIDWVNSSMAAAALVIMALTQSGISPLGNITE